MSNKMLNWMIATDKYLLLRTSESWVGYQWLRIKCRIKIGNFTKSRKWLMNNYKQI